MSIAKYLKINNLLFLIILVFSVAGFFYFEDSIFLRVMVIGIALIGIIWAIIIKNNSTSRLELVALLTLYLGSYSLYNSLYIISLPLALVMMLIILFVGGLFYCQVCFDNIQHDLDKNVFGLFLITLSFTILEIFLSLYFWPTSPEIKSFIIVSSYFVISELVYLYINNVLRLKRIISLILVNLIILSTIIYIAWRSLPR